MMFLPLSQHASQANTPEVDPLLYDMYPWMLRQHYLSLLPPRVPVRVIELSTQPLPLLLLRELPLLSQLAGPFSSCLVLLLYLPSLPSSSPLLLLQSRLCLLPVGQDSCSRGWAPMGTTGDVVCSELGHCSQSFTS